MDAGAILVTGLGLAVAAGLNAYIPLLIAGLLIRFDVVSFGAPYDQLGSTPALVIVTVLLAIELVADKVPAVDSINDVVQTVIRPLAGALLFAGSATGIDPQWSTSLALVLGLVTAAGVHGAKATARPVINASTAGVGGPVVSVVEDAFSFTLALAALLVPVLVVVLVAVLAWLLWSGIQRRRASRALTGG